jgi:hypothetical protein
LREERQGREPEILLPCKLAEEGFLEEALKNLVVKAAMEQDPEGTMQTMVLTVKEAMAKLFFEAVQ